jgi:hypothetical protein
MAEKYGYYLSEVEIYIAKKFALLAVDEILGVIQNLYFMGTVNYFQEVKRNRKL